MLLHKISSDQFCCSHILCRSKGTAKKNVEKKKHECVLVYFFWNIHSYLESQEKHLLTPFMSDYNSKNCKYSYALVLTNCRLEKCFTFSRCANLSGSQFYLHHLPYALPCSLEGTPTSSNSSSNVIAAIASMGSSGRVNGCADLAKLSYN